MKSGPSEPSLRFLKSLYAIIIIYSPAIGRFLLVFGQVVEIEIPDKFRPVIDPAIFFDSFDIAVGQHIDDFSMFSSVGSGPNRIKRLAFHEQLIYVE